MPAVMIHISIGSVYAFSVLTRHVMDAMMAEKSTVTWVFSVAIFCLGMSAAFLGNFIEKIGPRKSAFICCALFGTGLTRPLDGLYAHAVGIVNAAGTNMDEMGSEVGVLAAGLGGINLAAPGASAILTIFLAGLAIVGAMIVWISLLVRKALLLIAIVFAPVALAGSSWDHTKAWVSRWVTFVIAMILSKLVLVVIFLLATAQVSAPIDADLQSVSQPIAGVVLMLMAGFAPYLTYKAIAFMGFDMYLAMSAEQESKGALNRPMPIPLSRRGGAAEPPKVLSGASGDASSPPGAGASGGGIGSGGGGMGGGRGAASGGGAAAGGIAAGAVVAKEAAAAGPQLGNFVAASANGHSSAASSAPTTPPHVADSTLPEEAGTSR